MINYRIVKRYAQAIFGSLQDSQVEVVYLDLQYVKATIDQSKDLRALLQSPVVSHNKKQEILREIYSEHISTQTLDFLMLVAEKRRENMLEGIIEAFQELYYEFMNMMPIECSTAVEIQEDLKVQLSQNIANQVQKVVVADFKVKPELKGGAVVKIDDRMYDGSVRRQLELLYKRLAGAEMPVSLQNKLGFSAAARTTT
ncbi:MAG: ATP synthase F1 subunit delta [Ignavibacteria bacterium]|nr:ATP synthase F1 subunit delta [Ignavibacteria bacterium]